MIIINGRANEIFGPKCDDSKLVKMWGKTTRLLSSFVVFNYMFSIEVFGFELNLLKLG